MSIERALVTGAGGFIGSHLVDDQLAKGRQVTAFDIHLDRLAHLAGNDNCKLVTGDVRDKELLESLVKGQQIAKLLASDGQEVDNFGESVAVFGDRAVIGARNDDDNGFDAGAAYVFDISTGQELFKLLASDGESDDEFGCSVAICDVQVLVGARREDEKGTSSDAAYVFDLATGQQVAKLCASDGTEGGYFGWSAAFTAP